ncbi:MAG: hypothetical protein MJ198_08245 [Bacteroidales bacterium]|nr:hypothetical protein [Bacteroidales bacterium]
MYINIKSKFFTIILFVISSVSSFALEKITSENYESYGFTSENYSEYLGYYAISNSTDLSDFSALGSGLKSAVLTTDIDMSGIAWNPIGSSQHFTGIFDGNCHVIKNLSAAKTYYSGLFADVENAEIKNLGLENVTFSSQMYCGGICAYASSTTISNCFVSGKISITKILSVNSGAMAGGICGGGGSNITIQNCYCTATVSGVSKAYLGAFCSIPVTVENCYCLSENTSQLSLYGVSSKNAEEFNSGKICYLLNNSDSEGVWRQTLGVDEFPVLSSSHAKVYGNAPCITQYANEVLPHHEHSFDELLICKNCGLASDVPELQENDFYRIERLGHLYWFAQQVNYANNNIKAELANDIVVNESVLDELGNLITSVENLKQWEPIGTNESHFSGEFDGNGFAIRGMYLNSEDAECVGLFGYCENAIIKNVGVEDTYFRGINVGGICAYVEGEIVIRNCYNKGRLYGTMESVGGIIGCIKNTSIQEERLIEGCFNEGIIEGEAYAGGIVGEMYGGSIIRCFNKGIVVSNNMPCGGIVGVAQAYGCGNVVQNCYNWGNVEQKGGAPVAGIVGYPVNPDNQSLILKSCYSLGKISAATYSDYNIGGIYGLRMAINSIKYCYYLKASVSNDNGLVENIFEGIAEAKTIKQFNSGEICYKMNESSSEKPTWFQYINVDSLPNWDTTSRKVYYDVWNDYYYNKLTLQVSESEYGEVVSGEGEV